MILFNLVLPAWGNSGMSTCPCIAAYPAAASQYLDGSGNLVYINSVSSVSHTLEANYGLSLCKAWDVAVPECTVSPAPSWCVDEFCYVDGSTCVSDTTWEVEKDAGTSGVLSAWFPDSTLRYSYATCGTASYFSKYHAAAALSTTELVSVPEKYVREIMDAVEKAATRILDGAEGADVQCDFTESCSCSACSVQGGQWSNLALDLRSAAVTYNKQERGQFDGATKCVGRQVQSSYRTVAQKTYNDPNRVAYMYFGVQKNGAIVQWPATQWCPNDYDARFRPWYASAASGPKDVVLTLDNSGSMMANNRWNLLKAGVELVLRTLTEYDYVGLVLFSSDTKTFRSTLKPATIALKRQLIEWLDHANQDPIGGTNFDAAFDKTFSFIRSSRAAGDTTKCQTAVLFMTDGEDTSGFSTERFTDLQKGLEPSVIIFTYTFGSGASPELPKEIACKNAGVSWSVEDGGNIGLVMSDYYKYFANGVTNTVPRWVTYDDASTGEELMAACLPAYRNGLLLGTGCMDVNMLMRLSTLKAKPDYSSFSDRVRESSSECAVFLLPEEKLEEIRSAAGASCKSGGGMGTIKIIAIVAGGAVAIVLCLLLIWCRNRNSRRERPPTHSQPQSVQHGSQPASDYDAQYGAQNSAYGASQPSVNPGFGAQNSVPYGYGAQGAGQPFDGQSSGQPFGAQGSYQPFGAQASVGPGFGAQGSVQPGFGAQPSYHPNAPYDNQVYGNAQHDNLPVAQSAEY